MMQHAYRTNTSKTSYATVVADVVTIKKQGFYSADLEHLSDWLVDIQSIFLEHGYERLYIGGSSSREILDHILFDASLDLRDLDVYLIKGGVANPDNIERLASAIEQHGYANRGMEKLRPKLRANKHLPKPLCYEYIAGFGAHMFAEDQPILSLGLFNREDDLELNGIFNIDNIFLCLSNHESLDEFAQRVFAIGPMYEDLRKLDLVLDKHCGYEAWRHRKPRVLNWIEIERAFARHSLRIVRSYAKSSCLTLSEDLVSEFKQHDVSKSVIDNSHEFGRGLIKIFADRYWAYELKMLGQLGVLKSFSEEFEKLVVQHSPEEMQVWTVGSTIDADPLTRACTRAKLVLKRVAPSAQEEILPELLKLAPTAFGAH